MAKSQTNASTDQSKKTFNQNQGWGQDTNNTLRGILPGAVNQANSERTNISGTYNTMAQSPSGAYDPSNYNQDREQNSANVTSGGYDPAELAKLKNGVGGIDPTQAAAIRSGYGKLAETGGIDENTAEAMRRRASSGVSSVYSTAGENLARTNAASGFGGAGGETAKLARDSANAQENAITSTDANIGQLRQQGQIAGVGGLSNFEQGAAAGERQVAGNEAAGRLQATGQQQQLDTNAAQQKIQAAGGLTQLYQSSPGYVDSLIKGIIANAQTTGNIDNASSAILAEVSRNPGTFSTYIDDVSKLSSALKP